MNVKMTSVLVANRGEIARRIVRSCRDMGIRTVAVYSDADVDSPHAREADSAVRLPGTSPTDTYLRGDLLVAAARRAGADAVHPGYGFLSENADFARQVEDAGLVFVGPTSATIELMGDKLRSKALMSEVGVPVLRGVDLTALTAEEVADRAAEIGFPLLVKASAGGGGRGMRIVRELSELADAVGSAEREALSAFGDETVFLERYLVNPRHIEVQVFADEHGNVVSLFERECSIQRRHQKIVEESPSTAVDDVLRERLGNAAVTAARAAEYRGAGTVEFVLADDGSFYFLEMNTRLQVEHAVTEAVTGLDLVGLQLRVAQGEVLPPEALNPSMTGHAIEVRVYAEDPINGFLPTSGTVEHFKVPERQGLRVDSAIEAGFAISTHYDPMLAKFISHAPVRDEAAALLAVALRETQLDGVTTNIGLLASLLEDEDFLAGDTTTSFLDDHRELVSNSSFVADGILARRALAAALIAQVQARDSAIVQQTIPSGWRNNPSSRGPHASSQTRVYAIGERETRVDYAVNPPTAKVSIDGSHEIDGLGELRILALTAGTADLESDGLRVLYEFVRSGNRIFVHDRFGSTAFDEVERFPAPDARASRGSLVAPMPGSVQRVLVEVGSTVMLGDPLLILEAMKMEHTVSSPVSGVVAEVLVSDGHQVEAGAVLIQMHEEQIS
ncbi:acetyl/propionyl/methylcrotonyl-CoA carboxylase subunit alpha [Agromyces bauzanensis]|uniref:Biotin-dependent 3-methylcrotonyl-coenzyme A carboxylase alpha1 subunit n=1 Tax=Agromyces bauzanensis TaxID=1308924 RepID=A0A917PTH4_9MICO|nr:biotin carboxylase N-terminal domain-containing protein [Agromyces bauzanensis]GGJ91110.1 acetyl/propionyl-CoA carboxylase subuit alpha [Agromyces bauzanensis]